MVRGRKVSAGMWRRRVMIVNEEQTRVIQDPVWLKPIKPHSVEPQTSKTKPHSDQDEPDSSPPRAVWEVSVIVEWRMDVSVSVYPGFRATLEPDEGNMDRTIKPQSIVEDAESSHT